MANSMETSIKQEMVTSPSYTYIDKSSYGMQIKKKQTVSFSPEGSSEAGPSSQISYYIPPSDQFLVGNSVYFSWDVVVPTSGHIGGPVQNLIKQVIVTTLDGSGAENIVNYNVLYNGIIRNAMFSDKYELDKLRVEGLYPDYNDFVEGGEFDLTYTKATSNYDNSSGILTIDDSVSGELVVGDRIRVNNITTSISSITGDAFTLLPKLGADIANDAITVLKCVSKSKTDYKLDGVRASLNGTGMNFCFQLAGCGLLNNESFIPLRFTNGMRIEIHLDDAAVALAEGTSFTVKNMRMHAELVTPAEQVMAKLSREYNSNGLSIMYGTWSHSSRKHDGNLAIDITQNIYNAKNIFHLARDEAKISTSNDSFQFIPGGFEDGSEVRYQWEYNQVYFPVLPVKKIQQAYVELNKSISNLGNVQDDMLSYKDYKNNKFVIGQSLLSLPDDMLSGVSLKNGQNISLDLVLKSGPTYRSDIFLYYNQKLELKKGSVRVMN